jgi:hypothetical protein
MVTGRRSPPTGSTHYESRPPRAGLAHAAIIPATSRSPPRPAPAAEIRRVGSMLVHARSFLDSDADSQVNRLAVNAAVPNTLISCWIGFLLTPPPEWAAQVARPISHEA